MSLSEFSLIEKYFKNHDNPSETKNIAALSIGDDAAILNIRENHQLAVTVDTLIEGRHFLQGTNPADIGYKSVAVNVSDLAAMAATPSFFVLSLTLPDTDEVFIKGFSEGLFEASAEYGIRLVGGDTCRGPLSITIQASGWIETNRYISRHGAKPGDRIFVSGELGSAALGLACIQHKKSMDPLLEQHCIDVLNRPKAQIQLTPLIKQFASSCIDLSDGLLGDLKHILKASHVGAKLDKQRLPVNDWIKQNNDFGYALAGGDDYQLLFTVPENEVDKVYKMANQKKFKLYEIGSIEQQGLMLVDGKTNIDLTDVNQGFDHFEKK